MCIAENEAMSPWDPYHVDKGFKRNQNTVSLFVTDGEARVSEEFLSSFKVTVEQLACRVIGLQIGGYSTDTLTPFCDRVFRLGVQEGEKGLNAVIQEMK
jgi:uncharacterized protein with von Willebrand factor type A (vWA) domain